MKKCTLCVDRIYDQELPVEERQPACVLTCPAHARIFGDFDDPDSAVSRTVRERGGFPLMPELNYNPTNQYLPPRSKPVIPVDTKPQGRPEGKHQAVRQQAGTPLNRAALIIRARRHPCIPLSQSSFSPWHRAPASACSRCCSSPTCSSLAAASAASSLVIGGLIALGLIVFGLLSSTFHLANPKNAWRAFSRFRTSWLSREGVFAVVFMPLALIYLASIWFDAPMWLRGYQSAS